MTSSSVNGALHLLKGRLKSACVVFKVNVHLKEWLQDLLRHVPSSTDPFLHLVQRVLSGMKQSLIHRPVVVLRKFLDFFG